MGLSLVKKIAKWLVGIILLISSLLSISPKFTKVIFIIGILGLIIFGIYKAKKYKSNNTSVSWGFK